MPGDPSTDTLPTLNDEHHGHHVDKKKPGADWKAEEKHIIPKNNIPVVFVGLTACIFLAAIDQTIVATALPTIVKDLGGGKDYSWVGSSYLLAAAALSPLYGKLSDLIGRKPILYTSIIVFLIGSALCGAAQNIEWLIACRAVQGIGGGGILQLVNITIADIVPLERRGMYGGFVGSTWGIAAVVGPLLGGVFTDHVSWRWCFWINLPTGGAAIIVLFFFLHLNPHQGRTLRQHLSEFDFLGLALAVGGVVSFLLGFHESQTSWSSKQTIALLVVGGALLIACAFYELYTKRSPIIPPRLFKTRTTAIILITVFFHSVCFFAGAYYLPLYFQVLGQSATKAGISMLPYSLGGSATSALGGIIVARYGDYRVVTIASWALFAIGYGLMIRLDDTSSLAEQVVYPMIGAFGLGTIFQVPLLALQAAMPIKDMATSTAAFGFIRNLGSTVGISFGQVIYTSILRNKLADIPNLAIDTSPQSLSQNVEGLKHIPDVVQRTQVIHAYSVSISYIWIVCTPIIGVCFIMSLFMRKYTLKRTVVRAGGVGNEEAGSPAVNTIGAAEKSEGVSDHPSGEELQNRDVIDIEKGSART